jgi:hypothetical protein
VGEGEGSTIAWCDAAADWLRVAEIQRVSQEALISPKSKASVAELAIASLSQPILNRIEEGLGWIKTVAVQAKKSFKAVRVGFSFTLAAAT